MTRSSVGAAVAMATVLTASAFVFVVPHLRHPQIQEDPLRTQLGISAARSSRYRITGPDGSAVGWSSSSLRVVPGITAVARTEAPFRAAINSYMDRGGDPGLDDLERHQLQRLAQVRVDADGTVVGRFDELTMLGPEGLVLFGYSATDADPVSYDPPLRLVPHDAAPLDRWHQRGSGPSGSTYELDGSVRPRGPARTPLGSFRGCLTTRIVLTATSSDGETGQALTQDTTWCPGVGPVRTTSSGNSNETEVLVSSSADPRLPAPSSQASPFRPAAPLEHPAVDPGRWTMTRAGRVQDLPTTTQHTSTDPVWIDGPAPLLVFGEQASGDLVAVDAGDDLGAVAWRFHPGGPMYGAPVHDPERGRLYVGASDKRVYALDDRGMYLWSTLTGDNVAATPVVAGALVIVPSEDGVVLALEADSGKVAWKVRTQGAVLSSPAVVGRVAIVGSSDGAVRGIDLSTGHVRWSYTASGPVLADVVATGDGSVVVGADGGGVTELDAATGTPRWEHDVGADVRAAPAVVDGEVIIVDRDSDITGLSRRDGARRWSAAGQDLRGSPTVVGDSVVVAQHDGRLLRFDARGDLRATADAQRAALGGEPWSAFGGSPVAGAEGVWVVAEDTSIFRWSDAGASVPALTVHWADPVGEAPLGNVPLVTTPVAWNGSLLVIDSRLQVAEIDAGDGHGTKLGTIDAPEGSFPFTDPVLAGDVLIEDVGEALVAIDLPALSVRWSLSGTSTTFFRPVVSHGLVLWQDDAILRAVEVATGRVLGYSLFSIALLNWFMLTHDVDQTQLITHTSPTLGQELLGLPLLYALFAITLAGAAKGRQLEVDLP